MKKITVFIIISTFFALFAGCSQKSNKTPAEHLYSHLESLVEEGKIMFGHQDDLMYGHTWKLDDDAYVQSDIKAVCGKYPAVYGMDLGGIELDESSNLDNNNFEHMRASALAHYKRGGVITFSWHLRNPLTGGDSWDVSSDRIVASILPGGEKHDYFMTWLEKAADFMDSIRTEEGEPIPLIFRPWHEHTGSWFWWGQNLCTTEEYKELWKLTYEYMVVERGLNQLLWAYSPGAGGLTSELFMERYPGNEIIDIVGFDAYQVFTEEVYKKEMRNALKIICDFAKNNKKLAAITETGYEGIPNTTWWTEVLYDIIKDYPISYVLIWRNACDRPTHYYAPFPGQISAEDFKVFSEKDKMMFL